MNVGRRNIATIAACCIALLVCEIVPGRGSTIDFLIPGMTLESISLVPGARVAYLVTSESFGATDSSYVELRVVEHKRRVLLIEIISSPYPRSKERGMTVRLRLADRVTSATSSEVFRSCLEEMLIRDGDGAFRAPTDEELDDLDVDRLFIRANDHALRRPLEPARIATPAGTFLCDGMELARNETKPVSLGGVQVQRSEEETSRLWLSRDVPLWGLVKSSVEKKSFLKASGSRPGDERPRVIVTESILISYTRPGSRS
jgi:hypothetical protein